MQSFRLVLGFALLLPAVGGQPRSLWVVRPPNQVEEDDPQTFAARQTLKVSRLAAAHAEYLSINSHGQMLFCVTKGIEFGDMSESGERAWMWDGKKEVSVPPKASQVYLTGAR